MSSPRRRFIFCKAPRARAGRRPWLRGPGFGAKAAGLPTQAAIRTSAGREIALVRARVETEGPAVWRPLRLSTRRRVQAGQQAARRRRSCGLDEPGGPARADWTLAADRGRLGGYYDLKYYRGFDPAGGKYARHLCDWMPAGVVPTRERLHPQLRRGGAAAAVLRRSTRLRRSAVLGIGRLHPSKAHDVQPRRAETDSGRMVVDRGLRPARVELKAKAAEKPASPIACAFWGWRNDADALYRTADVCVFPSRYGRSATR